MSTQNPMDLDYRALGNAGLWLVGRLQTDADRARVVDGMSDLGGDGAMSSPELAKVVKMLAQRCTGALGRAGGWRPSLYARRA